MTTTDFGRPVAGTCGGGAVEGEEEGESDDSPLLKGFLRIEEPLQVLFVMMELRQRSSKYVILVSKLPRSSMVVRIGHFRQSDCVEGETVYRNKKNGAIAGQSSTEHPSKFRTIGSPP